MLPARLSRLAISLGWENGQSAQHQGEFRALYFIGPAECPSVILKRMVSRGVLEAIG